MNPRRVLWFAASLIALASVSCSSAPVPKWYEVTARSLTREDVYEKCLFSLKLCDYKIAKSDVTTGRIESQWDENLVPFHRPKGEGSAGFRRRAIVEINDKEAPKPGPNEWQIRIRVERERNDEREHPGESKSAKWIPDSDDVNKAQELAVFIKERVTPFEPSEDFRRRYGLDKDGDSSGASKPAGASKPNNP